MHFATSVESGRSTDWNILRLMMMESLLLKEAMKTQLFDKMGCISLYCTILLILELNCLFKLHKINNDRSGSTTSTAGY
jgi:hypothetical protein